jgi:fatty-acyl-CoA synthase
MMYPSAEEQREYPKLEGTEISAGYPSVDEIIRPPSSVKSGITFLDGGSREHFSYTDLADLAGRVATNLSSAGVRRADRIAMTLENDLGSVLLLLATWMAGCTVVSLPPQTRASRDWHAERFGLVLTAMGCEFAVDGGEAMETRPPQCAAKVLPRGQLLRNLDSPVSPQPAGLPEVALVQFTSGSVAIPKGATISAGALARQLRSLAEAAETDQLRDKFVSWLPLYHDMGLVAMFLHALSTRTEQVLMPPRAFALRPANWLATLSEERGTVTAAPNFAYRMAAAAPLRASLDLSPLRVAINAGERVTWDALTGFHEAGNKLGLRWNAVVPCYGLAENGVGASFTLPGRSGASRHASGHVSVGRAMPGTVLTAPAGPAAGPISIGGVCLFDGYHTADGFAPVPETGWHDTGDAGFIDDGELYVIGRRGETLSVAGHNVFAEDIEAVVHDQGGPCIRACAAFRLTEPGDKFGLMAELNPAALRAGANIAKLATDLRTAVIDSVRVRVAVLLLVRVGTIPRTTSGKVQRTACRALRTSASISNKVLFELTLLIQSKPGRRAHE